MVDEAWLEDRAESMAFDQRKPGIVDLSADTLFEMWDDYADAETRPLYAPLINHKM